MILNEYLLSRPANQAGKLKYITVYSELPEDTLKSWLSYDIEIVRKHAKKTGIQTDKIQDYP